MEKKQKYSSCSKTLCIILSLIMLLSAMPLTIIAFAGETRYAVGDIIEYGSYPQTKVTDTTITAKLKTLAGSTSNWTSYNYMSSTNTVGNYMKYTDVTYNGEKYRGVYFTKYRPYWSTYTASTSTSDTCQNDNGYTYGNTYWFKYEPIEWVILEAGTGGLAVCKNIIDSQAYCDTCYGSDPNYYSDSDSTYYCNNWEHSTIRTWLNSTFINTAFTSSQQNNIVETTISTPAYSTSYSQYDSADTSDKVFLLSYDGVQNTAYGFVSDGARQKTGTDYAKSQGLYEYNGYSYWWLRSAGYSSYYTCLVYNFGYVSFNYTDCNHSGVVAALYLKSYNPAGTAGCTHNYKSVVTAATLSKDGKIQSKCSVCGKISKTTTIAKIKSVTLSKTTYTYTGKALKPTVTVKDSNGKTISSSNYTVKYSNNIYPTNSSRTAKVKITFKGNYSGTKTLSFNIKLAQVKISSASMSSSYKVTMKWKSVEGATRYEIYYYNPSAKAYKSDGTVSKTSFTQTWKGWKQVKFKVRAVYMQGSDVVAYGPWSSVVTVKRK